MATINVTRCQNCKAIMNPNWTACLVCGTAERDPGAILADVYRRYWELPESEPIERFQALHREIDIMERQVGVDESWRTLEVAARRRYQEHRACPFCGKDELHLEEIPPCQQ